MANFCGQNTFCATVSNNAGASPYCFLSLLLLLWSNLTLIPDNNFKRHVPNHACFTEIIVASLLAQDVVFVVWCFQSNETHIDANPSLP